jgi:hypothetical protein
MRRSLLPFFALAVGACGFKPVAAHDLGVIGTPSDLGGGDLAGSTLRGVVGVGAVSPATVDLTHEGARDWIHWGYLGPDGVDRKAQAMPWLGGFTGQGSGVIESYDNNTVDFSWSDGDAHPVIAGTGSGLFVVGVGGGFGLRVPADTDERTLLVYVGGYRSRGAFHADVSDTPAVAFDDASFSRDDDGLYDATYTLRFRAGSPGQVLTVTWKAQSLSASDGNVTLQAVALR